MPNNKFGLLYAQGIVKQTLEPSTREKDTSYWNNVKDYGESISHWVRNVSILFNSVIMLLLNLELLQVILLFPLFPLQHHPNIKVLPIKEDKKKPPVDDEYEMHNQPLIYDEYEIDDSHEKEVTCYFLTL